MNTGDSTSKSLDLLMLVPLLDEASVVNPMGCTCGSKNGSGSGGSCKCGSGNGGGN